eukprot:3213988-Pleurochrysis_carterae.AAC.1
MSLPSSIAVDVRWGSIFIRLCTSARYVARAVLRADQNVHDHVASFLSCALDPVRATYALASFLAALAPRAAPPTAEFPGPALSRPFFKTTPPRSRTPVARGPSTHARALLA